MNLPAPAAAVPFLSVVLPAVTADRELRRCLDSVRMVFPDRDECEIVLVVPATQLAAAADLCPGERVIAESRRGVYGAMNEGVAASRGRYLYFIGKDDVLLPSARDAVQVLRERAPYVLFADVYWGERGIRRGRTSRVEILRANVCHQGIFYSREAVLGNGPYVRRLRTQADHLLNIRVLWNRAARGRVRYLALPVAWYAATGLSYTVRDVVFHKVHPAIIGRYLGPVAGYLWRVYKKIRPERGGAP